MSEMYIPDPIEIGEMRCEAWAAKNLRGDVATCYCGNEFDIGDGGTTSPDPYEIPVCPTCYQQWLDSLPTPSGEE